MYEYILSCLVGFSGGFCCRACLFSDKIRVETDEREIDELNSRWRMSRRYINYLEGIVNNTADTTTVSMPISIVDASANIAPQASVSSFESPRHRNVGNRHLLGNEPSAPELPTAEPV